MPLYVGLVHKDPESCYGISFPDAPGCFSAADDAADIFAMAEEALTLWLEGMVEDNLPIARPRTIEEIRHDPDWRESAADSVFAIGVNLSSVHKVAA